MLKPVVGRNQRCKCLKLRNALQISLLAAVAIWLLYQLKCSLDKKDAFDESAGSMSEQALGGELEVVSLGRRGLQPWVKKTGDSDEGRGSGDEQEREALEEESEVLEELIDEDDKEREEEIEDQGIAEMGKEIEESSSDDQARNESDHNQSLEGIK